MEKTLISKNGVEVFLITDDTHTLSINGEESTASQLAEFFTREQLEALLEEADSSEEIKISKALDLLA